MDDQVIHLSGRLGSSHGTLEKEPGAVVLRYEEDEGEEEVFSGRIRTVFESGNLRE